MKIIKLTRGLTTAVDDEDYERFGRFKWYALKTKNKRTGEITFYAARDVKILGKKITLLLHRLIMDAPEDMEVHHVPERPGMKADTLFNCKHRLEVLTKQQHTAAREDMCTRRTSTTGLIGVRRRGKSYSARLKVDGKEVHLGSRKTPEAAARLRDVNSLYRFGDFAALNYPELKQQYKEELSGKGLL